MNHRCECGSRIFVRRSPFITTAAGAVLEIPSAILLDCVRCIRSYMVTGPEYGKKTLTPFRPGAESEKTLFICAVRDWENRDHPEKNPDFVTIDAEDKADFERHGLVEAELRKK